MGGLDGNLAFRAGLKGKVIAIDDDGDAYIEFEGMKGNKQVSKDDFRYIEVQKAQQAIPPVPVSSLDGGASSMEVGVSTLDVGVAVVVRKTFLGGLDGNVSFQAGMKGKVSAIDDDGDAYIQFEGMKGNKQVSKDEFRNLDIQK